MRILERGGPVENPLKSNEFRGNRVKVAEKKNVNKKSCFDTKDSPLSEN